MNSFVCWYVSWSAGGNRGRIQMILEKINKPNDIHKIALEDFPKLAE